MFKAMFGISFKRWYHTISSHLVKRERDALLNKFKGIEKDKITGHRLNQLFDEYHFHMDELAKLDKTEIK